MLRVSLFGHLSVVADAGPLELSSGARALPVLAYLLLQRRQQVARKHVAFTLWPDATEANALANLRRHIQILGQTLPAAPIPWILADRVYVSWNPAADYWLDVDEFESRLAGLSTPQEKTDWRSELAGLQHAIDLYVGDLLVDCYDDWVIVERERLARLRSEAMWRMVGLLAGDGQVHRAMGAAARLAACDNLSEEYRRLAVGLKYLAGDRAAALEEFERYRELLAQELAAEPTEATLRLVAAVRESADAQDLARLLGPDLPPGTAIDGLVPRGVPTNLPVYLTSFVGREREVDEIQARLAGRRFLTLTGAGGCGKSRLAHRVALAVREAGRISGGLARAGRTGDRPVSVPDGVWWVDLAPVDQPELVSQEVAAALRLEPQPGQAFVDVLESGLRAKSMLLVLDNAEHLSGACAILSERLLSASEGLRILVTSRVPLGGAGEMVWPVRPLSVPPASSRAHSGDLDRFESTRLFLDRAQLWDPRFVLDDKAAGDISSICRRLDGIALGVELAASQVRRLPVAQIRDRLEVLGPTGDSGPEGARHDTLEASIAWSLGLASPPERALYRRLTVFRGSWTLDSAVAVCAGKGVGREYVPVLLDGLVMRSLAVRDVVGEGRRYRYLFPIRQHGERELQASGEEVATRNRHLNHFVALAELAQSNESGPQQAAWLGRLDQDHDNLRAALRWSLAGRGQLEKGLRLAAALSRYWHVRGHWDEGQHYLSSLLARSEAARMTSASAAALCGLGNLQWALGEVEQAGRSYDEAITIARQLADARRTAMALRGLGIVAWTQGDYRRAEELHRECLSISRQLGDDQMIGKALDNLGVALQAQEKYDSARQCFETTLAAYQARGDTGGMAVSLANLGSVALVQGDYGSAHGYFFDAIEIHRAQGNLGVLAVGLQGAGIASLLAGDLGAARGYLEESLALAQDLGGRLDILASMLQLGDVCIGESDLVAARDYLAQAMALSKPASEDSTEEWEWEWDGIACALEGLARLAVTAGDAMRAARLCGAADRLRLAKDIPAGPVLRDLVKKGVEGARAAAGDRGYAAGFGEGRALDLEEAMAYALGDVAWEELAALVATRLAADGPSPATQR